jgi:glutamate/tyrosine decarboxylase-like PLP-dependent enzyme
MTSQELQPALPGDLDFDELRRVGRQTIETIAEYHANLGRRPVLPRVSPAEVAAGFAGELPEEGEPAAALIEDFATNVVPLLTAVGSPRHFGYVNGSGAMIGIFAEALAACVNTNAGAWKLGPAATEIERQCLRWCARFVGYPEEAGGILVSGGTMANFTALLTALRHLAPYDSTPGGLQDAARGGRFLVYMSDHEGHVSIARVADMLNLGRDAVRLVPSGSDFRLDATALERMIVADRARGELPFCVVAQLGSVNVGAVDAVDIIAEVCARHRLWLHGDGACGLLAAGLDETRHLFRGLERADSLSFDAHKWLGVPHDCGVVLVREAERLRRAFSIAAPYLRSAGDAHDGALDYLEYGPQMSRGFRALKLWMVLRHFGRRGLAAMLGKSLRLARHLHELVREHPDFAVLHEPTLYVYSFRYVPWRCRDRQDDPAVAAALDRLNDAIAQEVTRSGHALVMTTRIRGRVALRFSICSQRTLEGDIDSTFEVIARAGRRLTSDEELGATPISDRSSAAYSAEGLRSSRSGADAPRAR